MAFTLERFAELRSHLFHTTSPETLDRIRTSRRLQSAARLAGANHVAVVQRRSDRTSIVVDGAKVVLMDQGPLHENNIELRGA